METTAISKAEIKNIVCEILEVEPSEMTSTSRFNEDHDADSLLAIEVLASLEKTFKIAIDQAELNRMVNLDGVYAVVADAASTQ